MARSVFCEKKRIARSVGAGRAILVSARRGGVGLDDGHRAHDGYPSRHRSMMSCLEWTSSFRYTRFVYVFTVFSETSRARAMAATVSPRASSSSV